MTGRAATGAVTGVADRIHPVGDIETFEDEHADNQPRCRCRAPSDQFVPGRPNLLTPVPGILGFAT